MKIKLNNGVELVTADIQGGTMYFQNRNREYIEFQFAKEYKPISELDELFSNVENMQFVTIDGIYVHCDYILKNKVEIKRIVVVEETSNTPEIVEERVCITMAQLSYEEKQAEVFRNETQSQLDDIFVALVVGGSV